MVPTRKHYGRLAGLAIGYAADRLFADPRRAHPVAAFGTIAGAVQTRLWSDSKLRGGIYTTVLVGGTGVMAMAAQRAARSHRWAGLTLSAATTWAVLGGRSLGHEATAIQRHLNNHDIDAARARLTHLVSRDTSQLDEAAICRATIESVAENTSDAVIAPLCAGLAGGVPAMVIYRAINTLDAMVGYPNERFRNFGWASARLDDVVNYVPARLSAALAALAAPTVAGSLTRALAVWRRDGSSHPSPNAGPVESSFAGALDVQLGGVNTYDGQDQDRHRLGDGPSPHPDDITRAVQLAERMSVIGLIAAAGMKAVIGKK